MKTERSLTELCILLSRMGMEKEDVSEKKVCVFFFQKNNNFFPLFFHCALTLGGNDLLVLFLEHEESGVLDQLYGEGERC